MYRKNIKHYTTKIKKYKSLSCYYFFFICELPIFPLIIYMKYKKMNQGNMGVELGGRMLKKIHSNLTRTLLTMLYIIKQRNKF